MKPVPFAQYLARQQQGASAPAVKEALSWPPAKNIETIEQPKSSPLLRKAEPQRIAPVAASSQRIEQGRLTAFEDGREAARAEFEAERANLRAAVAEEIAKARSIWTAEEGARLTLAHRAAIEAFETRCAQAVANILRPFTTTLVIGRVTELLVQNLEVLFASRTPSLFEISGPADLLDALREKFADRDAAIVYKPNDRIDIRVRVDDTIIETQLGPWMKALGAMSQDLEHDPPEDSASGRAGAPNRDQERDLNDE
jgi:hypothetical protein